MNKNTNIGAVIHTGGRQPLRPVFGTGLGCTGQPSVPTKIGSVKNPQARRPIGRK